MLTAFPFEWSTLLRRFGCEKSLEYILFNFQCNARSLAIFRAGMDLRGRWCCSPFYKRGLQCPEAMWAPSLCTVSWLKDAVWARRQSFDFRGGPVCHLPLPLYLSCNPHNSIAGLAVSSEKSYSWPSWGMGLKRNKEKIYGRMLIFVAWERGVKKHKKCT